MKRKIIKKKRNMGLQGVLLAALLLVGCKGDAVPESSLAVPPGDMPQGNMPQGEEKPGDGSTGTALAPENVPVGVTSIDLLEREDFTANTDLEDVGAKYYLDDTAEAVDVEVSEDTITVAGEALTGDAVASSAESITLQQVTSDAGETYMVLTVTKGGIYRFTGSSEKLSIRVNAGAEQVWLILDEVTLTVPEGPVIYVLQADKTSLHLAAGSENVLADKAAIVETEADVSEEKETAEDASEENGVVAGEETVDMTDAVIYAKDDLIINGSGSLQICGNVDKGIHGKDDLRLRGGALLVTSVGDAIQGNDSIEMSGGHYTIQAGKDGLVSKTPETTDSEKGYITISGGKLDIVAAQDGIQAGTDLTIEDGEITITAGGGAANGENHTGGGMGGFWGWGDTGSSSTTQTESKKGIKAEQALLVQGGILEIDSADDAVHSNHQVYVEGGYLQLSSGDDGIHGENELVLTGNSCVTVTKSYEGLEGASIVIAGGCHHVTASDDGLNAAGGTMEDANGTNQEDAAMGGGFWGGGFGGGPGGQGGMGFGSGNQVLDITGGYLYVDAAGDGLDSNGALNVSGGITVVAGPTNSGNGPLDCGEMSTVSTTGGILLAVGSTGMMETPESNCAITTQLNAAAGTVVTVTDEDNQVLVSFQVPKQAAGLVASVNGMSEGYKIYTGGTCTGTYNADKIAIDGSLSGGTEIQQTTGGYGGGFGGGFGGGGMPGGQGRPGGR